MLLPNHALFVIVERKLDIEKHPVIIHRSHTWHLHAWNGHHFSPCFIAKWWITWMWVTLFVICHISCSKLNSNKFKLILTSINAKLRHHIPYSPWRVMYSIISKLRARIRALQIRRFGCADYDINNENYHEYSIVGYQSLPISNWQMRQGPDTRITVNH